MAQITVHRKGHHRRGYTRKDGTMVKAADIPASTFEVEDRGEPGKTPKSEQWYHPDIETGWHKGDKATTRRRRALSAHKGDKLATARSLQALANVTTDAETRRTAEADADYFFRLHNRSQGVSSRRNTRLTPKTPRISPKTPRIS